MIWSRRVEQHQFPFLQVALAPSKLLIKDFASESVYLGLEVWVLSSEISLQISSEAAAAMVYSGQHLVPNVKWLWDICGVRKGE